MIQPAIDDLLSTVLADWYALVADWSPPGAMLNASECECRESSFNELIESGEWPHSVVHELVAALEHMSLEIAVSVNEDTLRGGNVLAVTGLADARSVVFDRVATQADDILDVLQNCVSPRMDAYVAGQLARFLRLSRE